MKKVKPTTNKTNPDHQIIPFPGLRPFRIEESHLFFGREGQSEDVLAKLAKNKIANLVFWPQKELFSERMKSIKINKDNIER